MTVSLNSDVAYVEMLEASVVLNLSSSKPKDGHEFPILIRGNQLASLADYQSKTALVTVSAGQQSGMMQQSLSVIVSVSPFASCMHTLATLTKGELEHTDTAIIILDPYDVDMLPITQTEFLYQLQLFYEGTFLPIPEFAKARRAGTGNDTNTARIPSEFLTRAGKYTLKLDLVDGWRHDVSEHGPCSIGNLTFAVKCAAGFKASDTNQCERSNPELVCTHAKVKADNQHLSLSKKRSASSRMTGPDLQLEITLSETGSQYSIWSLPLKGINEKKMAPQHGKDTALLNLHDGKFALDVLDKNGLTVCSLVSELTVTRTKCPAGSFANTSGA